MQSQNRFCHYPSTGCSGAAPSSVVDAIVSPPGLEGGEKRGALDEPRAPRGRRLPLSPPPAAAPLSASHRHRQRQRGERLRSSRGGAAPSRRSRPREEVRGRRMSGEGGRCMGTGCPPPAWGGRGGSCKGVSPLLSICAPIACVQEGTSLLRGHRFGTAACPISCRPLSMPLLAEGPPGLWQLWRCVYERLLVPHRDAKMHQSYDS